MKTIWFSSPEVRKTSAIGSFIAGFLIILLAQFIPSLIVILMSLFVLLLSVLLLITGVSLRGTTLSIVMIILGVLGCILSMSTIITPDMAVSFLGVLIGIWVILLGIIQFGYAPTQSSDKWSFFFMIVSGIVSILVGIFLLFEPYEGLYLLTLFFGIYLIISGILLFFKRDKKSDINAEFTVIE